MSKINDRALAKEKARLLKIGKKIESKPTNKGLAQPPISLDSVRTRFRFRVKLIVICLSLSIFFVALSHIAFHTVRDTPDAFLSTASGEVIQIYPSFVQ